MSPQICFRFRKWNNTKIIGKWNPCFLSIVTAKESNQSPSEQTPRLILWWKAIYYFEYNVRYADLLKSTKVEKKIISLMERLDWNHIENLHEYNHDVWILDWLIFSQKLKGEKRHDIYQIRVLMYITFKKMLNVRIVEIPVAIKGTVNLSL